MQVIVCIELVQKNLETTAYRIKVAAEGSRITLRESEVIHITVNDEAFQAGQWGLGTWRTKAEFRDPMSNTVKPRCFLIMPFGKEFDFVLRAPKTTPPNGVL
jgi:uncharacterized protein (DUF2345 family)